MFPSKANISNNVVFILLSVSSKISKYGYRMAERTKQQKRKMYSVFIINIKKSFFVVRRGSNHFMFYYRSISTTQKSSVLRVPAWFGSEKFTCELGVVRNERM